ncbi:Ros/MucR family transcriptional regulator [Mesorhizobium sp. A556]
MNDNITKNERYLELTADIVSAYVSNNPVPAPELASLIASVNAALSGLGQPIEPVAPTLTPAVNPKKSVFPDYIVSLEDGRKFKSMKRHLGLLGLTPDEYRAKWSLPHDYPMVAPSYSAARSALAKTMGLGRKPTAQAEPVAVPVKRGRKPKAA